MTRAILCFFFILSIHVATSQENVVEFPVLRQELLELYKQDQNIRLEQIENGYQNLELNENVLERMSIIDSDNTILLREIISEYGWPTSSMIGQDGMNAIFTLIVHSELALQDEILVLAEELQKTKEFPSQAYALLLDSVLVAKGKPQIYGTKVKLPKEWLNLEPTPYPIQDESRVDERRIEAGLPLLSEYLKDVKLIYFPN